MIHNPSAGDAKPTAEDLKSILADAGFQVHYRSTRKGWKKALAKRTDLIVAAGGDGTVAKVCRELVGTGVPLALLPRGTANNIARTLGVVGDARAHAASWRTATARPFDVGTITSPAGEEHFVESAGGGLFAAAIAAGHDHVEETSTLVGGETDRAMHLLRELLADAESATWRVDVDGRDLSGDYLAVEVMNIRFIGPSVPLAPSAEPGDGLLDVVLVREADRQPLLDYLDRRVEDASAVAPDLVTQRGRRVRLEPDEGVPLHVDDDPLELPETDEEAGGSGGSGRAVLEIAVDPGAVSVMPPAPREPGA